MIDEKETPQFLREKKRLISNYNQLIKEKSDRQNRIDEKLLYGFNPDIPNFDIDIKTVTIDKFARPRKASYIEINPLLVIRSPREIPEVKELFDKIDFVDKVWMKNFDAFQVLDKTREFVKEHPEYTHIILTADDVYPDIMLMRYLIDDILLYDVPVISGCINLCNIWSENGGSHCDYCEKKQEHKEINITSEPVDYKDWKGNRSKEILKWDWITEEFRKQNLGIHKCWFQGHAFAVMRRDIFDAIGSKPYSSDCASDDIAFAIECCECNIPQFVDFRAWSFHSCLFHHKLNVGIKESEIIFEKRKTNMFPLDTSGILNAGDYVPMLVCSPFNNEEQSITQFIAGMLAIDYPKDLMDVIWIENDSVDGTWENLQKWYRKLKPLYHSLQLIQQDHGLKRLGKATISDFVNSQAGKNKLATLADRMQRGERLRDIYHFFFEQIDKERHKYVFFLFADVVVPPNIITRYLEVFKLYKDAGWVGGVHHKRFPYHIRPISTTHESIAGVAGPLMKSLSYPYIVYTTDEDILAKQVKGEPIFECAMTGHAWIVKPEIYWFGGKMELDDCEIVYPFIKKLWSMELKVYCASDIYLKHISLDGKIYRNNLLEEVEKHAQIKSQKSEEVEEKKKPDNDYDEYLEYKKSIYPLRILDRPLTEARRNYDPLSQKIINQTQWDELYGKWSAFIKLEKGEK